MIKILENELNKALKGKRLMILTSIMVFLSVFFGIVVMQIEKSGMATDEMMASMKGGYFCIQILGLSADMILPIFATLFVCFFEIDEYNNGTLKLPILCGHSRKKIIIAKILAVIIMMMVIILATWLCSNIVAMLIWGTADVITMLPATLLVYLKSFVALAAWSMVMFTFSLFIQNSGIMIGIMVAILVITSIAGGMFPQIAQYIMPYYLKAFASTGTTVNSVLGLTICVFCMLIFGAVTLFRFERMEIQK